MKQRLVIILFIVAIMITGIIIVNLSIRETVGNSEITDQHKASEESEEIYSERKLFERSHLGYIYDSITFDTTLSRNVGDYYKRRAYAGAPPTIPHPLLDEKGIGGKNCLSCHRNGGYVDQFKAYAPVTPHPEMLNCRQCHVPVKTDAVFGGGTNFEGKPKDAIHQSAMPGSPPMMPHDLQMKENCLACHAGPAARKDIRVTHPYRANCRQCHVPNTAKLEGISQEFSRPIKSNKK